MNHIEVELKLSAQSSAIDAVRQSISTLSPQHSEPCKLTNIYFDTAERQLRQWDMGLRIRGCDGRYEMTIKTALKALEEKQLIYRKRQGIGRPNRIYVKYPDALPSTDRKLSVRETGSCLSERQESVR